MKICDLININKMSLNFDQVKYFFTHALLGNPTDTPGNSHPNGTVKTNANINSKQTTWKATDIHGNTYLLCLYHYCKYFTPFLH